MSLLLESPSSSPQVSKAAPCTFFSPDRPMAFPNDSSDSDSSSEVEESTVLRDEAEVETSREADAETWLLQERDDPLLRETQDRFSLFPIQ